MRKLAVLVALFLIAGFFNIVSADSLASKIYAPIWKMSAPDCSPGSTTYDITCVNFCSLFNADTRNQCATKDPQLANWCKNTAFQNIYNSMLSTYHTLEHACQAEDPNDVQGCLNDWTCYWVGGTTANPLACQGQNPTTAPKCDSL